MKHLSASFFQQFTKFSYNKCIVFSTSIRQLKWEQWNRRKKTFLQEKSCVVNTNTTATSSFISNYKDKYDQYFLRDNIGIEEREWRNGAKNYASKMGVAKKTTQKTNKVG